MTKSKEFKINSNYFTIVYAYLTLDREIVSELLSNLQANTVDSDSNENEKEANIFDFIFSIIIWSWS